MSLGYKPRMIIDVLIVFTGTPAECGEQSKQRMLSPVGEQTRLYMWITLACMCPTLWWKMRKDTNALVKFENAKNNDNTAGFSDTYSHEFKDAMRGKAL